MKLSKETINTLEYFFERKCVYTWTGWENEKENVLRELPSLKVYLEKQRELERLESVVFNELVTYNNEAI